MRRSTAPASSSSASGSHTFISQESRLEQIKSRLPLTRDIGYYPNLLIRTGLPYRRVDGLRWTFREGRHRIQLTSGVHPFSGEDLAVPYGGLPRVIFAVITTSVKKRLRKLDEQGIDTENLHLDPAASQYARTVSLGRTKRHLLRSLGIAPGGDSLKAVEKALLEVFQSSITYTLFEQDGLQEIGSKEESSVNVCIEQGMVASSMHLWQQQDKLGESGRGIVLSELMLKFIRGRLRKDNGRGALGAVPIDRRVTRLFRGRPFAFDVYLWHCVKAYQSVRWGRALPPIAWTTLMDRFPTTYSRTRSFRAAFLEVTDLIKEFWPGLDYSLPRGRIQIHAKTTHVPIRSVGRCA